MIGPKAVNGPTVGGAGCWAVVPELRLEQQAAGGVEAASVRDRCRVLAGGLGVGANRRRTAKDGDLR